MKVAAIWASLNEDVVVDSEVYTDLDPLQAPLWTIHLELNDNVPSLMVKNLLSYLDTCRSTDSTEKILGKNYTVLQSPGQVLKNGVELFLIIIYRSLSIIIIIIL